MNYNIKNIILDKIAFKEWEEKMKKVNIEYNNNYMLDFNDILERMITCKCGEIFIDIYNYRHNAFFKDIYSSKYCRQCIINDKKCQNKIIGILPIKYF